MSAELNPNQRREVQAQVARFLQQSQAFATLPRNRQHEIIGHTAKIVEKLAEAPPQAMAQADPYATDLAYPRYVQPPPPAISSNQYGANINTTGDVPGKGMQGNAAALLKNKQNDLGSVIGAGVTQAARMVKEIDFPTFVASLVEGTFHAIVKSSIEQMTAYAEMVKSVSSSLSDFRDQNTTDNQARDHLVERYPQHFQLTIVNGQPKVGLRDGADDLPVPKFKLELGTADDISSLDEDMIEEKLVPAARDDLARGRQQLLATIVMMGINRIVVTDGKINAKIRFEFKANEKHQMTAQAFDYVKTGNVYTAEGGYENTDERTGATRSSSADGSGSSDDGSRNQYAKGTYKSSVTPDVRVTSQVDTSSTGAIQASGQIMGEVSINFKSETFPLEKMIDAGQMMNLEAASGGGRVTKNQPAPRAAAPVPATAAPAPATGTQTPGTQAPATNPNPRPQPPPG
jgi:hypothetical protein